MKYIFCRGILIILLLISIKVAPILIVYISVWLVLLEILNRNKEYIAQQYADLYNLIFTGYVIFIFNRFVFKGISTELREIINRIEHVSFAFVLCLFLMQFLRLFGRRSKSLKFRLIVVSITFQFIGILNEVYQFLYSRYHSEFFSTDTKYDLLSNVVGNVLFVILVVFLERRKQKSLQFS